MRRMAHDPVVAPTVRSAEHLEPRFVFEDAEAAADAKLERFGKQPNRSEEHTSELQSQR